MLSRNFIVIVIILLSHVCLDFNLFFFFDRTGNSDCINMNYNES